MPTLISSLVLQSNWTPSGETTTGVLLFQSLLEENQNDCQFLVRLKFGMNGLETPIYTENKGIFLEPGSSALIDFRSLVPDTLSFNDPDIRWIIETRLGFNFAPISVKIQEFNSLSFENELTLAALNTKAEKIHNHQITDIQNLNETLLQKLDKPLNTPTQGQVLKATNEGALVWGNETEAPQAEIVSWEKAGLVPPEFAQIVEDNAEEMGFLTKSGTDYNLVSMANLRFPATYQTIPNNAHLYTGSNFIAGIGVTNYTLPDVNGSGLKIFNATSTDLIVNAKAGSTITAAINGRLTLDSVTSCRIKAGNEATFTYKGTNQWQGFGVHMAPISIPMIVNPPILTSNTWNPFDLFHNIEQRLGQSVPTNPAQSSFLTVIESSTASGWGSATVLSNRTNAPTTQNRNAKTNNETRPWWLWMLPSAWQFHLTGIAIQTQGFSNSFHPRAFGSWVRNYDDKTEAIQALTGGTGSWAFTRSNQTQINAQNQWHLFTATTTTTHQLGNSIAFFLTGDTSTTGDRSLCLQRICFYGNLTTD